MTERGAITVDEVRRRAAVASVSIDEELIDEVALAMDVALEPLRRLDPGALRSVEPAVRFVPPRADDRRGADV